MYGDRDNLPLPDNSFDAVTFSWAEVNHKEAYRVLKNNGYLIQMGAIPEALCGEINNIINGTTNNMDIFQKNYSEEIITKDNTVFSGIPLIGSVNAHRFTYISQYRSYEELSAIAGRLFGPKAKSYFADRKQNTYSWRLEILIGKIKKSET